MERRVQNVMWGLLGKYTEMGASLPKKHLNLNRLYMQIYIPNNCSAMKSSLTGCWY